MKKVIILMSLMIFYSCATSPRTAGPGGSLTGKIEYKTNRTFWSMKEGTYNNGIIVVIQNTADKKAYSTESKNGYYVFNNLPAGEYRLWQWKKKIRVNSKVSVFLRSSFDEVLFTIHPSQVTTLNNITALCDISKDFSGSVSYRILFNPENSEDLQNNFLKNKRNEKFASYTWQKSREEVLEDITRQTDSELAGSYFLKADNDLNSINTLYAENEFYLSFMLFYRLVEHTIKAVYVINKSADIPDGKDLRKLAESAELELSADERLFLFDITTISKKINDGSADDGFVKMFDRAYFNSYFSKLKAFTEKIHSRYR